MTNLTEKQKKNKYAQSLAKIRWGKTTKKQRQEHARKMSKARWDKNLKETVVANIFES